MSRACLTHGTTIQRSRLQPIGRLLPVNKQLMRRLLTCKARKVEDGICRIEREEATVYNAILVAAPPQTRSNRIPLRLCGGGVGGGVDCGGGFGACVGVGAGTSAGAGGDGGVRFGEGGGRGGGRVGFGDGSMNLGEDRTNAP